MTRLSKSFFDRDTLTVARDLVGRRITFFGHTGRITQTEAYVGQSDPACHAARGKTPRNAVMFGPSGVSYVYFIYGMYHCLNIVTEAEGFPAAVLIRGILEDSGRHLNGPGKLCREWGITKEHNGVDITKSPDFYLEESPPFPYGATPRIGIREGTDKLWRFVAEI